MNNPMTTQLHHEKIAEKKWWHSNHFELRRVNEPLCPEKAAGNKCYTLYASIVA